MEATIPARVFKSTSPPPYQTISRSVYNLMVVYGGIFYQGGAGSLVKRVGIMKRGPEQHFLNSTRAPTARRKRAYVMWHLLGPTYFRRL